MTYKRVHWLRSLSRPQPWLSNRKEQALRLMASGYGNKEIAAELNISVKTVEAHRSNAMCKLGLQGRKHIARFALRQSWLQEK